VTEPPTDPYAPPPEGWTPPPPAWGGDGSWPGPPPPRTTPFTGDAVVAGLPLLLAAFLTATTGWGVLHALIWRAIASDEIFDDFEPVQRSFLDQWWPAVATGIVALLAVVAWISFAMLLRARKPEPITLLPYGILGALVGMVLGLPLVHLVGGLLRPT